MNSIRIAMWSGPRCISTAMMRSFENRNDTVVVDEPFYAHYLTMVGIEHPMRNEIINNYECNSENIISYLTGQVPGQKDIWYQKHMAHHVPLEMDISWIKQVANCFLIRNPKEVILSFQKQFPIKSVEQLGYNQLFKLFNFHVKNLGFIPPIIDSRDVLENPEEILSKLCDKIGITFSKHMLSWPSGGRDSDGIWGKYWYKNVEQSTGFQRYNSVDIKLPNNLEDIYKECLHIYEELHSNRILA